MKKIITIEIPEHDDTDKMALAIFNIIEFAIEELHNAGAVSIRIHRSVATLKEKV